MSRTKLIYFLTAFVVLIGCLALNTSYSLFVQTETINNVDSFVPTLSYSLGDNNLLVENIIVRANSNELVKVKINNLGSTDIKYILSLKEKIDGVNVSLVKLDGNDNIGDLKSQNSKYVWFNITNSNLEDKEIIFSLIATYYTLNFNEETLSLDTNIDKENLYEIELQDTIKLNAINNSIDNSDLSKSIYVEDISLLSENNTRGLLLNIEDDYTNISGNNNYYFNGNVIDNYINFANMCFRIVSIQGDGSVKLILEDIDNICEESDGNYSIPVVKEITNENIVNEEESNSVEIIYNGTYGYQTYNEQIILNYLNVDSSISNISMSNVFKNFQLTLNDYLSYMKVGNWCIDNNLYEDELGEKLVTDLNTNYDNWTKMYYDSYVNIKNSNITLKCNSELLNKYNDNTDMYVGTLTSDEVYLAGISENSNSVNNYLMNSYSLFKKEEDNIYNGINFWTLSPSHFDGLRSYAYIVNSNGNIVSVDLLNNNITFRPSIILSEINKVISGNGTKSNPYKIIEENNSENIEEQEDISN